MGDDESDEVPLSQEQYTRLRAVLEGADVNGDARLSLAEVLSSEADLAVVLKELGMKGKPREAFKRLDRDHDGYITPLELFSVLLPGVPRRRLEQAVQEFEEVYLRTRVRPAPGQEQDGRLPPVEQPRESANQDPITKATYFAFREFFDSIDSDKSGFITVSELSGCESVFEQLWPLFGERGRRRPLDREAFRRMDRDRDGTIAPYEMLREMLPHVPAHRLKTFVAPWEEEWLAEHPPSWDDPSGAPEERKDYATYHTEDDRTAKVISEEAYVFYKEIFEDIDTDGSGEVSLAELKNFVLGEEAGAHPMLDPIRGTDWKRLDINRDGYISFDELLRKCFPQERAFRVRRDICIHSEKLGLPKGCKIVKGGLRVETQRKQALRQNPQQQQQGKRRLPPISLGGLPLTTPTPARKGHFHEARIHELETLVRQLSQRAAEQKERELARSKPGRRCLVTPEQLSAANSRLHYEALARRQEVRTEATRAAQHEQRPPSNARFLGAMRVPPAEVEALNERFFTAQCEHRRARQEAAGEVLAASTTPPKLIPEEQLDDTINRLARTDVKERSQRHADLARKWDRSGPRKTQPAAVWGEVAKRLYGHAQEWSQKRGELKAKHGFTSPRKRLTRAQQERFLERLAGK